MDVQPGSAGYGGTAEDYAALREYAFLVARQGNVFARHGDAVVHDGDAVLHDGDAVVHDGDAFARHGGPGALLLRVSPVRWLARLQAEVSSVLASERHTAYRGYAAREAALDAEMDARLAAHSARRLRLETPELPADADGRIGRALQRPGDVVVTCCDIPFTGRDLATLQGRAWLNDEVINAYCQLIAARSLRPPGGARAALPRVHAFSTFFYPKLRDRGYGAVRTATRRLDPPALARDVLLFPVHLGVHWCMAVADTRTRRLAYYDSLHGDGSACLDALAAWLASEAADKGEAWRARPDAAVLFGAGPEPSTAHWGRDARAPVPVQENGYDCGVFSLLAALCAASDVPVAVGAYAQADMGYWRRRISHEILSASLLP